MTNDQQMLEANKQERIAAVKANLDSTIENLITSGRLSADKVEIAHARFDAVIARMNAASVRAFMGIEYMGDDGVQRLISKFRA